AADVFGRMVAALGGPADFVERYQDYLPRAPVVREVRSVASGFVTGIRSREIGMAVVGLGGGRTRPEQEIDHAVGISDILPVGAEVRAGDRLALVHARREAEADEAAAALTAAYSIGEARPRTPKAVLRRVRAG